MNPFCGRGAVAYFPAPERQDHLFTGLSSEGMGERSSGAEREGRHGRAHARMTPAPRQKASR